MWSDEASKVVAWGKSGDLDHVPDLIARLESSDGNVRRMAASALGKLCDRRAVGPLLDLLEGESKPQVRQYAVKALGSIGAREVWPVLQEIAEDPAEMYYVRRSAVIALGQVRPGTSA